jgi:two-component system, OmpR family, phosphate regulon response regulator PhoB
MASLVNSRHSQPRILIVDDEKDLVRLVKYNLEQAGFTVETAYDGAEALDKAWTLQPDLVVLDLMLPDCSGFELCHEIKLALNDQKSTPVRVIMLTARSAEDDRLQGFEAGADDYVTKPFSPKELVYRIKAMLRRAAEEAPDDTETQQLHYAGLRMDCDAFNAWCGEELLKLTRIEFRILESLMRAPGKVQTREALMKAIWGNNASEILDRTVDAHVKRLRGKLGPTFRDAIETVRGIGYRLMLQSGGLQPVEFTDTTEITTFA